MPRHSTLSNSAKKRRQQAKDTSKKCRKRARSNPPSAPPSQEEEQENRERRLQQKSTYITQRRERERSQQENQLMVGGDVPQAANTNQILQQMHQENHADRMHHVINAPRNPELSTVDAYAKRMDQRVWSTPELYAGATSSGLSEMNLNDFCQHFTVGIGRSAQKNKIIALQSRNFTQFSPSYSCNPNGKKYVEYCRLALVRFKEWKGDYHAVYGGSDATDEEVKRNWEDFLREWSASGRDAPDFLQQQMTQAQENLSQGDNSLNGGEDLRDGAGGELSDDEDGDDELRFSELGGEFDVYDEEVADIEEWAQDDDWTVAHHLSKENPSLFPADPVAEAHRLVQETTARRIDA